MKAETIQKIVNLALVDRVDDVGAVVSKVLEQEKQIKSRMMVITNIKRDYLAEVRIQIEELNKQIKEVQDNCTHAEQTRYGDPSGGNAPQNITSPLSGVFLNSFSL